MRSERRQAILDAAWRCAARKRFGEMTVDDVCAEAGLSKGAFYGYFESKDELLGGLLEDDAAALDAILAEIAAGEQGGVERLRRFARAMLEHADDPGRAQVRADLWAAASSEPALRSHLVLTGARRRTQLRSWIETSVATGELREVPANALAALLLAMADGLMLHATIDPGAFRWANVHRAVDELLAGITPG